MTFLTPTRSSGADPVRLPHDPGRAPRSPFPFIAAFVPLIGAVAMWLITTSPLMLVFAALSPLMLVGAVVDRARGGRRFRREQAAELRVAIELARSRIEAQHERDRAQRWQDFPDVERICDQPVHVWRAHPVRAGTLTLGTGDVPLSAAALAGDDRPEALQLRELASVLPDAPVHVPLDGGICVRGPYAQAAAVARALLLHVALVHPPGIWHVIARDDGWEALLPHAAVPATDTIGIVPASSAAQVRVAIVVGAAGSAVPPECTTVLDVTATLQASVLRGSERLQLRASAVGEAQCASVAEALMRRAGSLAPPAAEPVMLADLSGGACGVLGAAVGRDNGREATLDIVEDGPHAVVVGSTGAGKSEFLITWVLAMARAYTADEVQFVLADFKGGTAFEPLAALPHVVGVLTDLDGSLAERAVRSLAAEVRRRERVIAGCGARDITDDRVTLARLFVMVDEFPAMLAQHPELEPVFLDIAARGRALGIHLVLGGQRIAGVVRDGLLTNCPLRIALRVTDANDSMRTIGTDEATRIPGSAEGRGLALVRRAGDVAAHRTRIALSDPDDIAAVRAVVREPAEPSRPWLPPLPETVRADDLHEGQAGGWDHDGAAMVGVADDPDHQAQPPVVLRRGERGVAVVGAARSGKSSIAALIGSLPAAVRVPADAEAAWDAMVSFEQQLPELVVVDDFDALIASYADPWQMAALQRWEALVRGAGRSGSTIVLTAQRAAGPVGRILDLLPRRALLSMRSVTDHLQAGDESGTFRTGLPAGRGWIDGLETQFLLPSATNPDPSIPEPPLWRAEAPVAGVMLRAGDARIAQLERCWGREAMQVTDVPVGATLDAHTPVLVGDPAQWQRCWSVLEEVRRAGDIVVGSECATEMRTMLGIRELPPYATAGRAWLLRGGSPAMRVRL